MRTGDFSVLPTQLNEGGMMHADGQFVSWFPPRARLLFQIINYIIK